ncbi:Fungal-specific transcription factor protein [Penicillium verhagenii]|uniref:Fungal-specific transcription factor protein n=1 Tax=Penicillium verhagenii TaxID=1562060 RepID=UPI002544F0EA|nr:Fungal-specific transcription factor protein [Penicillium verhagenii]KAJ5947158.1 Fungal-specific transcription factor protein [Penicillium verhagenii]
MSDHYNPLVPPLEASSTSRSGDVNIPPPAKGRDKPQLSCNACRRRKVRCDRLQPCSNCSSRGHGTSCKYTNTPVLSGRFKSGGHVQERINRLENLVLGLMQQSAPNSHESPSESGRIAEHLVATQDITFGRRISPSGLNGDERSKLTRAEQIQDEMPSPSPSDYGSIRLQGSGVSYVSSAHWTAVLDSIDELRDHFEQEDNSRMIGSDAIQPQVSFPSPQLLYGGGPLHVTPASILNSLPTRPTVDRLVARYFNFLDMAPGVPHSDKFLREYEEFWKFPEAAPIIWLGLLFGMMCLSTQFQQSFLAPTNTLFTSGYSPGSAQPQEGDEAVSTFRENMIHCLILGHYTKGGPYVLETLILYFMVEVFAAKDTEAGTRILVGNIVQIAMHMGYHRDAKHFPNISPFAGEMRRRVWALIVQLDFSISSQVGLPRIIKENQTDVTEPRNLADSDLNEFITELPPSRPETEVTPTLYTLAKLRLISVGAKVADVATEPRPYSYAHVLHLDKEIDGAREALPSSMKWVSLASSLSVSSQVIIQRIWLEVSVQRLKIVLHKQFMVASHPQQQYPYSVSACLVAATKILELQHLIDEETQLNGRMYQSRWRVTASFTHDFLLATSILCFYLQAHGSAEVRDHSDSGEKRPMPVNIDELKQLLRKTQAIWLRESETSREARRAAVALQYVIGDPGAGSDSSLLTQRLDPSFQGNTGPFS